VYRVQRWCIVAKRSDDQDATWFRGRPWPRQHCVGWRPTSPTERGTAAAPTFRPTLLWNGRPSRQLLSSCNTKLECDGRTDRQIERHIDKENSAISLSRSVWLCCADVRDDQLTQLSVENVVNRCACVCDALLHQTFNNHKRWNCAW